MSTISQNLEAIKSARYGEQVRGAIHDSIKECYDDVTTAKTKADDSTTNANKAAASANAASDRANTSAQNADASTAAANQASDSANTAASSANDAAENANAAAKDANTAGDYASRAASSANEAANSANTAASSANNAAENANVRAAEAHTATENAESISKTASAAASSASVAASNANAAATEANNAASRANTEALNANSAALSAGNAASAATQASELALIAAGEADAGAKAASDAAAKIDSMTVSHQNGEDVDVEITERNGVKHLHFTLVKGETPYIGENGNWWISETDTGVKAQGPAGANGTGSGTVTGVKVNDEVYEPDDTGVVDLGEVGDGSSLPDGGAAGQILAKKTDGNGEVEWVDPPEGTLKSVCGKEADENGDVDLNAMDVGAVSLPSEEDPTYGVSTGINADMLGGKTSDHYATKEEITQLNQAKANKDGWTAGKNVVTDANGNITTEDKLTIPTVPSTMPNPYPLTINGESYDGSKAVDMNVSGLPAGGTTGQVLFKASDADNDVQWANPSGGMEMKLIWENPSPTNKFNAQTISLEELGDYCGVIIVALASNESANAGKYGSVFVPKNNKATALIVQLSDSAVGGRYFSFSENGVTVSLSGYINNNGGEMGLSTHVIPTYIYGVKGAIK